MKLEPAIVSFDSSGTPFSPKYGDIYHSTDSGPGQARHVFLGGNDLPARWADRRLFTIVEAGFGFGLNFLATWQAWRADPSRAERLHFVAIEKHPFSRDALSELHARYAGFGPIAAQLQAAWPQLVPGLHRLHFEEGRVTLTLAFADIAQALRRLRLAADAFYLDGFAPELNPEMWSPQVMKTLARLARPAATAATYTAARAVRDALAEAGFEVDKRPGFGRKRDMLTARYAPRFPPRHPVPPPPAWQERRAIVVGAGLAGAAICERLAARGWRVDVIERNSEAATDGPSMRTGAFQPQVSSDDSFLSRLTRTAYLYALRHWHALELTGSRLVWARCGVLQIARSSADESRMAQTVARLGYPSSYVEYVGRDAARLRAGIDVVAGGLWFPEGGWVKVRGLIMAQLSAASGAGRGDVVPHFGVTVGAIGRADECWSANSADGRVIANAPVMVLANAHDAARLVQVGQPLRSVRGQVTYVPAAMAPNARAVLTGMCQLLPPVEGVVVVGSSYDFDDDDPAPRTAAHVGNLERLSRMLGSPIPEIEAQTLEGGVGFRCVAPDRLPLIGALPDWDLARANATSLQGAHAPELPRLNGLYGAFAYASRGLIWSALAGEIIASEIEGEPLPLESDLADAVDPGRFLLKLLRRGRL